VMDETVMDVCDCTLVVFKVNGFLNFTNDLRQTSASEGLKNVEEIKVEGTPTSHDFLLLVEQSLAVHTLSFEGKFTDILHLTPDEDPRHHSFTSVRQIHLIGLTHGFHVHRMLGESMSFPNLETILLRCTFLNETIVLEMARIIKRSNAFHHLNCKGKDCLSLLYLVEYGVDPAIMNITTEYDCV